MDVISLSGNAQSDVTGKLKPGNYVATCSQSHDDISNILTVIAYKCRLIQSMPLNVQRQLHR
jgi:hypothetical protein